MSWPNSRTRPATRSLTRTLRQGLAVQLEQSPFLTLVSDQQIQQVLRFMNRPPETRLTPEVAREICERTGSDAVLEGSIAGLGSQYVLWLRARNCRTGEILAEEQAQAGRKEEVLNALTRIAIQIRTRLGESLATIQEHSTPLEQATTPSLEALKAYSAGRNAMYAHGSLPRSPTSSAPSPSTLNSRWRMVIYRSVLEHGPNRSIHRVHPQSLCASGSRQRPGKALDPFSLRPPGDGKLAEGAADSRNMGANVSARLDALSVLGGLGTQGTGQYERGIQAAQEDLRLNPDDPFGVRRSC